MDGSMTLRATAADSPGGCSPRRRRRAPLLLASLALGASACAAPRPSTPVILVSIDTLRPDHLGCYGYRRPTSPHLDAFREDSVLVETAIAHAPSTLISHASILTSLLPPHHGASIANDRAVPLTVVTLAEVLRDRGYATASFNGGMQLDAVYGLDQGFDAYVGARPWDVPTRNLVDETDRFAHVVERARRWIAEQTDPRFFLFLHTYEVHHPYSPDPSDLDLFSHDYRGSLPDVISVELLKQINSGARRTDARDRQHVVDAYDAEIRSMDRAFGHLVSYLKSRGLYETALVVVTSDHGEEFFEHGKLGWHSHTLFDELLRVPLLVKLPYGRLAGARVQEVVRGIDIAPTIVDALDETVPAAFGGLSFLSSAPRDAWASETWSTRDVREPRFPTSLRTPRWKLVNRRLYDLMLDPGERVDVAGAHPDVVKQLAARGKALVRRRPRPAERGARPDDALRERLRALGYLEED